LEKLPAAIFRTVAAFPPAKSVVFAAYVGATF
jgi:hypothetical protein